MYDKENIIDDYVFKILQEVKAITKDLIIVANFPIRECDYKKLIEYGDQVIQRKNKGYDWGAWKEVIINYVGRNKLINYDELVLLNDTFYGPFYPFERVFFEMENARDKYDFWGITVHGKDGGLSYHEHIQSYFLVVSTQMLHSKVFWEYWYNLKTFDNVGETILYNEVYFTKFFSEKGFKYGAYCDTRSLEPDNVLKINHYVFNYLQLIKKYKSPIIKKKVFGGFDKEYMLTYNHADELKRAIDYIGDNYDYDLSLIFKNLLRTTDIAVIQSVMNLNFILPNFCNKATDVVEKKVCIICHLYYIDLLQYCLEYIKNIPEFIDVYVTTSQKEILNAFSKYNDSGNRKVSCLLVDPRGRDLAAFLIGCKDIITQYDYICFLHDKKSVRDNMSIIVGKTFCDMLWDNLVGGSNYIRNIISLLDKDKFLGLLVPPQPYYGEYKNLGSFWTTNFNNTKRLLDELGVNVPISDTFEPLAVGSAFWVKRDAIIKLFEQGWGLERFPQEPMAPDGTFSHALERTFPYLAQEAGFYTGVLMNEYYAAAEINNLKSINVGLKNKLQSINESINNSKDNNDFNLILFKKVLIEYLKKNLPKPLLGPAKKVKRWLGW